MPIIKIKNLTKKYGDKIILDNISFNIDQGDFIWLMGQSGAGKTTLLNIIGGLEDPTSGDIVTELSDDKKLRVGFVHQDFFLQKQLTLQENIGLPGVFANIPKKSVRNAQKNSPNS